LQSLIYCFVAFFISITITCGENHFPLPQKEHHKVTPFWGVIYLNNLAAFQEMRVKVALEETMNSQGRVEV
jgi:hypothetical protein